MTRVVPGDVASSAAGAAEGRERSPVVTGGVNEKGDGPEAFDAFDTFEALDTFDTFEALEALDGREGLEPTDGSEAVDTARAIRPDEEGCAAVIREELGDAPGPALPPASMPATRRARTSSVFFATRWTHSAISGERASGIAPSIAPAR